MVTLVSHSSDLLHSKDFLVNWMDGTTAVGSIIHFYLAGSRFAIQFIYGLIFSSPQLVLVDFANNSLNKNYARLILYIRSNPPTLFHNLYRLCVGGKV